MANNRQHSGGQAQGLAPGAHLVSPRRGYLHHGIYIGDGRVIHYSGLSLRLWRGPVEESTLAHFADGRGVAVKTSRAAYPPEQIVARARSRLGENRYRLTSNNCEHFCEWCIRGESRSEQVERLIAAPRAALQAATALLKRSRRQDRQPAGACPA